MQCIHKYCFQQQWNHSIITEVPKDVGTLPDIIYIKNKFLMAAIAAKRYDKGFKPITIITIN